MVKIPAKVAPLKRIQILVVEDEQLIALSLKESLESLGYAVPAIAGSGEKAVEKATKLRPDLVLMDIRIKGDMDGIEAAEQIWERLQIPVIYATGHSDRSTLERAKITVPFGYVLKPFKERELAVAIEIALQHCEREQLLMAILKGIGDGVIVVDQDYRVQFLNPVAEALTGWQLSEARGRELTKIFLLVDEQTQQLIDNPVATALQQDILVRLKNHSVLISQNGVTIPIAGSAAPIRDNKGAIAGAVLVFRDISDAVAAATQRQRVEAAIRQQLENERKLNQLQTQIIRTVSHEYRTPLSTILVCAQLLESNIKRSNPEKQLRNCQRIQASVKYMVGLLEDMLTFNQAESGELKFNPAPLELELFCSQLVEEYELIAGNQQEIQLIGCDKGCIACVDKKLLKQILGNLLSNALKYSSTESRISLAIQCKDNQVIFQVRDWGMGIPQEDQPHLFEPFYRGENVGTIRGTGMGLAIVRKAVDLHGGTVSVESEIGIGTTFTVSLPGGRE